MNRRKLFAWLAAAPVAAVLPAARAPARGGLVTIPHLGLVGETCSDAVIPLPAGRSIPVALGEPVEIMVKGDTIPLGDGMSKLVLHVDVRGSDPALADRLRRALAGPAW